MSDFADDIAEDVAGWASVQSPRAVAELVESLPEGIEKLGEGLGALAEHLAELGGLSLEDTSGAIGEMVPLATALKEGAEKAALAFSEESAFWMGGGD